MKKLLLLLVIGVAFSFASCSKDKERCWEVKAGLGILETKIYIWGSKSFADTYIKNMPGVTIKRVLLNEEDCLAKNID